MKSLSRDEVFQHNHANDAWMVVNGQVLDITQFIKEHPGGPVIEAYAGRDATDVFTEMHPKSAHGLLKDLQIGTTGPLPGESGFEADCRQLRRELLREGRFDADMVHFYTVVVVAFAFLGLGLYLVAYGQGVVARLLGCLALAIFWQQTGWISHDQLHYSVFSTRERNWILPFVMGACGAGYTYIWWQRKHNTHHAMPNVIKDRCDGHENEGDESANCGDPDIHTLPFLLWSRENLEKADLSPIARILLRFQHFYFIPLLCIARISWNIQSSLTTLEGQGDYPVWRKTQEFLSWRLIETISSLVYWVFFPAFFYLHSDSAVAAAGWWLFAQCLSGLFLAGVFVLNHSGCEYFMDKFDELSAGGVGFYELQVRTGRNVSPSTLTNWFMGHLNYQIEHHMFPRMPRSGHAYARDRVRALCAKYDVPYHETGFWSGIWEVVMHLRDIAGEI